MLPVASGGNAFLLRQGKTISLSRPLFPQRHAYTIGVSKAKPLNTLFTSFQRLCFQARIKLQPLAIETAV